MIGNLHLPNDKTMLAKVPGDLVLLGVRRQEFDLAQDNAMQANVTQGKDSMICRSYATLMQHVLEMRPSLFRFQS